MCETELLESTVSEYQGLKRLPTERWVRELCNAHDWTEDGARAIVSLAQDYGAFMLRNALALAIALEKEDGDLGF